MAKDAVEKIKAAEREAEQIRLDAANEAKKIFQTTESDVQKLLDTEKNTALEKAGAIIAAADKEAEKIQKDILENKDAEYERILNLIEKNSASVAKKIVKML